MLHGEGLDRDKGGVSDWQTLGANVAECGSPASRFGQGMPSVSESGESSAVTTTQVPDSVRRTVFEWNFTAGVGAALAGPKAGRSHPPTHQTAAIGLVAGALHGVADQLDQVGTNTEARTWLDYNGLTFDSPEKASVRNRCGGCSRAGDATAHDSVEVPDINFSAYEDVVVDEPAPLVLSHSHIVQLLKGPALVVGSVGETGEFLNGDGEKPRTCFVPFCGGLVVVGLGIDGLAEDGVALVVPLAARTRARVSLAVPLLTVSAPVDLPKHARTWSGEGEEGDDHLFTVGVGHTAAADRECVATIDVRARRTLACYPGPTRLDHLAGLTQFASDRIKCLD